MTLDYTVYLLQKPKRQGWLPFDLDDIDEVTANYYHLIISDRKRDSDSLRNKWYEHVHRQGIQVPLTGLLSQIAEPEVPADMWPLFPTGSFFLRFALTLDKPLITRDDEPFYVIENPVAKDTVFRQPMMPSTSWKGLLRYAMRLQRKQEQKHADDEVIVRLFGTEKKETREGEFKAGRLTFFTTFFNATDLEVLNPHIRERKVGTQPIPIECIREGAQGKFHLLYTPFDLLAHPNHLPETAEDLEVTVQALRYLMLDLGFSAKRTSGYGVIANRELAGVLQIKVDGKLLEKKFDAFPKDEEDVKKWIEPICKRMRGERDNE